MVTAVNATVQRSGRQEWNVQSDIWPLQHMLSKWYAQKIHSSCLFILKQFACQRWLIYSSVLYRSIEWFIVCTTMFCRLYNQSPWWPMGLFTRSHRIPPATASIQCLETHDHFPWPVPHSCVLHECVCVAVAESVRSGSVAVVSGIYYSDHWWLQAYL